MRRGRTYRGYWVRLCGFAPIAHAFARKFKNTVGFDVVSFHLMNHTIIQEADSTVLRVRGELDALSCPELRLVLDALAAKGKCVVIVDLSELRLIDSSGVGVMVSLYKRVRANGGEVKFVGVTAQPLVIFKLLRLDRAFELS